MKDLFYYYPSLREKLPLLKLGDFPTPIQNLKKLSSLLKHNNLYIKRDDISNNIYGGNKVRKLEFILADLIKHKKRVIITFGLAGSNYALATTIHASEVGLKTVLMLLPQPNSYHLQENLLLDYNFGADLHQQNNTLFLTFDTGIQIVYQIFKTFSLPKIIPPGGSSVIGIIGFVNAAFELYEQIYNKEIPEPDFIYIPIGSMGSAVGLTLGFKILGLKSKIISIRVVDEKYANLKKMIRLFKKVNRYLNNLDKSFPIIKIKENDFQIKHNFFGHGYGLFTNEGNIAAKLMNEYEGIKLDGIYSAKAFAALIDDIKKSNFNDKILLFWNTGNSIDLFKIASEVNYHKLPHKFYSYFESSVQALEQKSN